jgi:membrane associated rhomboid family serine protease
MPLLQNVKNELKRHSTLTILIAVNVVLFFILNVSIGMFNTHVLADLLVLPLNLHTFLFRPWTLFTYMFAHIGLGHVFYNMLLLYFSAQLFLRFLTERKFLFVYIMSGITGGLVLLVLSAIFPSTFAFAQLSGASAAMLGIVASMCIYRPNMPVLFFGIVEMKYKYMALIIFLSYTIIDFNINTGGKISHFGGVLFGLLFGYLLKQGKDISTLSFLRIKQKSPLRVVQNNAATVINTPNSANQQHTIDSLLDKISKIGYDNLSKAEKELLFKLSQKK